MNQTKQARPWLIPVIIAAAAVVVIGAVVAALLIGKGMGKREAEAAARPVAGADGRIPYATDGVIATDPETLQDQVDKMLADAENNRGVTLEYKNMMVSDDGVNFTCYLGNAAENPYDMFFTIYGDQGRTEEWYLSELLRPGTRFEQIAFQKKLAPGTYTGYLFHTQVNDEAQSNGSYIQVIQAQIGTAITIVVNDY